MVGAESFGWEGSLAGVEGGGGGDWEDSRDWLGGDDDNGVSSWYDITARWGCTPLDVTCLTGTLLLLPGVAGVLILSGVTEITGGSDFTGDAVCLTAPGRLRLGDDDLDLDDDLARGSSLTGASLGVAVVVIVVVLVTAVVTSVGVLDKSVVSVVVAVAVVPVAAVGAVVAANTVSVTVVVCVTMDPGFSAVKVVCSIIG